MNTYFGLYLLTMLDGLVNLFTYASIISCLAVVFIVVGCAIHYNFDEFSDEIQERKKIRSKGIKMLRWITPVWFIFGVLSVVIPTRNEAIFIIAGGKTIDFIKSDSSINAIPAQTTRLINQFLENQIKHLEKEENENN